MYVTCSVLAEYIFPYCLLGSSALLCVHRWNYVQDFELQVWYPLNDRYRRRSVAGTFISTPIVSASLCTALYLRRTIQWNQLQRTSQKIFIRWRNILRIYLIYLSFLVQITFWWWSALLHCALASNVITSILHLLTRNASSIYVTFISVTKNTHTNTYICTHVHIMFVCACIFVCECACACLYAYWCLFLYWVIIKTILR